MNILIVSGFLGAGKTTFIKELIRRTGTNPVILENEYGDNSIDANELRNNSPSEKKLEVLEFMEGCVCCTMKDSFINSVLTVFSSLNPEYLVIEPTGVGKLSNIVNNLKPILHGSIRLLPPIVVTAPCSYRQNMNEWGELYRDQVANAKTVVFSKCEYESSDILSETGDAIRKINPEADIICSHYSGQSEEWWRSLMGLESAEYKSLSSYPTLDSVINQKLAKVLSESFPGSSAELSEGSGSSSDTTGISQITINDAGLENPAQLIQLLEDCLRGEFGLVARAKGTIPVGKETLRFDLADRLYSIAVSPEAGNQCVFIGKFLDKKGILSRLNSFCQEKPVSLVKSYIDRRKS
ncbi:MAG: GTP-binding protein [Butyrivibrio sp.]|nr:GTP-binding protein [Butyrivibrio sp.]